MFKKAILLLSLFISCSSEESVKEFDLTGKVIGKTTTIADQISVIDDLLIAKSSVGVVRGDETVSIYNLSDFAKIDSCDLLDVVGGRFSSSDICYGNYDDDMLPLYISSKGRMSLYTLEGGVIKDSVRNDIYSNGEFSQSIQIHKLSRYNSDCSVGLVFRGNDKMFALFDNDYKLMSLFGDHPYGDISVATFNLYYSMDGFLKVNDDHIIYAPTNVPYLSCYTIKDGVPTKLWEKQYNQDFVYELVKGKMNIDKYQHGYLVDVALGDEYIYMALYSGLKIDRRSNLKERSDADKILVFDYEGNSVATLNLDDLVHSITVSEDEKTIYSTIRPNSKVVTYEIPSFE